jgi:hypothetical protein
MSGTRTTPPDDDRSSLFPFQSSEVTMSAVIARARCAVIGHHRFPSGTWTEEHDYVEPDDPRCELCHAVPRYPGRRLARFSPIWLTRRRWKISLRVGLPYHAYVAVGLNLGGKRDEQGPEIDASLILGRFHIYAWLGGFQWQDEDCSRRALAGISASFVTSPRELQRLICRWRGHQPEPSDTTGWVFCERCEETLERPDFGATKQAA